MKKNIMTIMAVVCMFVAIGGLVYTKHYYENKLSDMAVEYEQKLGELSCENNDLNRKVNQLNADISDMDEQVYNLINNKAYKVRIHHDDKTYIYEKESDGIFGKATEMIIY